MATPQHPLTARDAAVATIIISPVPRATCPNCNPYFICALFRPPPVVRRGSGRKQRARALYYSVSCDLWRRRMQKRLCNIVTRGTTFLRRVTNRLASFTLSLRRRNTYLRAHLLYWLREYSRYDATRLMWPWQFLVHATYAYDTSIIVSRNSFASCVTDFLAFILSYYS